MAYFIGGNRCAEANDFGDKFGAERFDDTNLLGSLAGQREVEKFNERYGLKKKAAPEVNPTEDPPSEDPPAEDADD